MGRISLGEVFQRSPHRESFEDVELEVPLRNHRGVGLVGSACLVLSLKKDEAGEDANGVKMWILDGCGKRVKEPVYVRVCGSADHGFATGLSHVRPNGAIVWNDYVEFARAANIRLEVVKSCGLVGKSR